MKTIVRFGLPLAALVSFGFALRHVVIAEQMPPKRPPAVEPSQNPFPGTLAGTGMVEAGSENIAIGSHLPGVVAEVFADVGTDVDVGTALFRLDDRHLQAELVVRRATTESSRASLAKLKAMPRVEEIPIAEARLREAQAVRDDARDQLARNERGFRTGAIPEDDYSKRKHAVASAEALVARAEAELKLLMRGAWKPDIDVAEAQVRLAEAHEAQTRTEIERLTVRSAIRGRVLQKNVRPGEYVAMPSTRALFMLGDVKTLHVRMDVDENELGRFRTDLHGKGITRGVGKREIPLKFVRIEPMVVPKQSLTGLGSERVDTRVLQVILRVDPVDSGLFVGQQMDVFLDAGGKSGSGGSGGSEGGKGK